MVFLVVLVFSVVVFVVVVFTVVVIIVIIIIIIRQLVSIQHRSESRGWHKQSKSPPKKT